MSHIAPTLQTFFSDRLMRQREASPRTIAAYRDTIRLLLNYAHARHGIQPAKLSWQDLDATLISAFLDYLEHERGNCARTRNARLAAIRSLYAHAALQHPEHAHLIARVLAIPPKRHQRRDVHYLTPEEGNALINAPDRRTWTGRRDHSLMLLAMQTGLRVSELITLDCSDVRLDSGAHVRCHGKGRKSRAVPITAATANHLRTWLKERSGTPHEPLFPTSTGKRLSRDAIERLVAKHAERAADEHPTLRDKQVTPHVLRHSNAMNLLHAGVDTSVIALWLGHANIRSTNAYLHADITIKQRALDRTTAPNTRTGTYRPPDTLLAYLESL